MSVIKIESRLGDYEVNINSSNVFLKSLVGLGHKLFLVDENVWHYYAGGILSELPRSSETMIFPSLESRKTLEGVQEVYEYLINQSAKRNMTLITIGGGILQDITGFAACTLYRGIRWVFIPTTLLAQSDSCIGSKTSLNYKGYKNLIGTFYPPSIVWINPLFINTLTTQDFYSGLGEIIKLHIIGGESKIQQMLENYDLICARDEVALQNAIQSSLEIKRGYIVNDEFDNGQRNMLNYGHCVGHALESVSEFRIPHGQAVIVGMMIANYIASERGVLSNEKRCFIEKKLLVPSLKTEFNASDFRAEEIIKAMGKDKKRTSSGLVMIMLKDSNEMIKVKNLEPIEVEKALKKYGEALNNDQ